MDCFCSPAAAAARPRRGLAVAASLLTGSVGVLAWASDGDVADATSLLAVLPRSLWACGWGAHAAWDYRQCMTLHQVMSLKSRAGS